MPYSGPNDDKLPERIQRMPESARERWVGAWNGAYAQCQDEGGEDCEGRAFAIANAAIEEEDMEQNNFLFFDLQEGALTPGKPFPGFATGSFVDMMGREIELKADDLKVFLTNTLARINEYKTRNMPGLPIDARNHDKGDAAGWIVGAELSEVTDSNGTAVPVIQVIAEWTKIGADLIRDKIMTNFSPTVDMGEKSIVGGSLTNWPASVDDNGVPLFTAVELAQGIHYLSQPEEKPSSKWDSLLADLREWFSQVKQSKEEQQNELVSGDDTSNKNLREVDMEFNDLSDEQRETFLNQARDQVLAELAPGDDSPEEAMNRIKEQLNLQAFSDVADLGKAREALLSQMQIALKSEYERMQSNAGTMLAQMMGEIKREQHIAEFAQSVTAGTQSNPRGLPVGYEEVEAFLSSLNDKQREAAESILTRTIKHGLTEYAEMGHGRKTKVKREVPSELVPSLKLAVENGADLEAFFEFAGYGNADDYDLSKYEGGK